MRRKTPIRPGSQTRRFLRGAAFAICAAAIFALGMKANPGLVVTDLNHGVTPTDLANALVGTGVTISNVSYVGNARAAGTFAGATGIIGFPSGIVLGSGAVQTVAGDAPCGRGVEGPNNCYEGNIDTWSNSTDFIDPGDADLTALSGFQTFDAAVLEFDFVPEFSNLQFKYVFSSEEYNDYANTSFNDVFAFFVNGVNCAVVPLTGEPVSVNTINNGSDFYGDPAPHHPELFRDNVRPAPALDTQMDGLTDVLTCSASVNPGQKNHRKLAIADASDGIFDATVFIKTASLVSGTVITTKLSGGGQAGEEITVGKGVPVTDSAVLKGGNSASAGGTVTYSVFSDEDCKVPFGSAGVKTVANGVVPDSDPMTFTAFGTYYWMASYSGDSQNNASVSDCGEEKVTVTGTSGGTELIALGPAKVFVGLANSDDVGLYFDLKAEVLAGGNVVASGLAEKVWGGSSGFNNARKSTLPLVLGGPVEIPDGGALALRISVRQACTAPQERNCPTGNACRARLWYNDAQASSGFAAGIEEISSGQTLDYFLLNNFLLGPAAGPGPKKTVDVGAGKRCSDFKPFGTWKITID